MFPFYFFSVSNRAVHLVLFVQKFKMCAQLQQTLVSRFSSPTERGSVLWYVHGIGVILCKRLLHIVDYYGIVFSEMVVGSARFFPNEFQWFGQQSRRILRRNAWHNNAASISRPNERKVARSANFLGHLLEQRLQYQTRNAPIPIRFSRSPYANAQKLLKTGAQKGKQVRACNRNARVDGIAVYNVRNECSVQIEN